MKMSREAVAASWPPAMSFPYHSPVKVSHILKCVWIIFALLKVELVKIRVSIKHVRQMGWKINSLSAKQSIHVSKSETPLQATVDLDALLYLCNTK